MSDETKVKVRNLLLRYDKFHQFPYAVNGDVEIGYGRNLSERGITNKEALDLLDEDIFYFNAKCHVLFTFYQFMDDARKACLIKLIRNEGINPFLNYHDLLKYLDRGDYNNAASEILKCKRAQFSPEQYQELCYIMRTGELS